MRRPACAREALGLSPLVEALRAYSPRIECVPEMAAVASPAVFFAVRPTTKRASYARAGRVNALVLIEVAIQDGGRFGRIREGTHAQLLWRTRSAQESSPSALSILNWSNLLLA